MLEKALDSNKDAMPYAKYVTNHLLPLHMITYRCLFRIAVRRRHASLGSQTSSICMQVLPDRDGGHGRAAFKPHGCAPRLLWRQCADLVHRPAVRVSAGVILTFGFILLFRTVVHSGFYGDNALTW